MRHQNNSPAITYLRDIADIYRSEFHMEIIGNAFLCCGDCMCVMAKLPDNCIDSAGLDSPYGIGHMGKEWDNFSPDALDKASKYFHPGVNHVLQSGRSLSMHAGQYDTSLGGSLRYQEWCYIWAVELLRVLKPGSYAVLFCSPRRVHRLACALEDAGFEIRDIIPWIFGSGMPKSKSISGGIDKLNGIARKIVWPNPNTAGRAAWNGYQNMITALSCSEAKKWNGWGTNLKPSNEPILLVRKPISEKSVAGNVLRWNTGGLNIDACRIGKEGGTQAVVISKEDKNRRLFNGGISNQVKVESINKGRYPSNTIISEQVALELGEKADYFYCPKVSKKERNAGCEHLEAKVQNSEGHGRTYNDRCAVCGRKFIGSENTRCQCPVGTKKTDKSIYVSHNNHPTVKPIKLMEYLVRLITPKGGICMDCFMGSGSTGIACGNLGFDFLGIEKEAQYFEIAKARIQYWQSKSQERRQ